MRWSTSRAFDLNGGASFPGGVWNTSGHVGIGTTSPAESLHTTRSIYAEGGLFLKNFLGEKIRFIDNTGSGFALNSPVGNAALTIVDGRTYAGQELTPASDNFQGLGSPDFRWGYLRVGTGPAIFEGNVGIGTTTPQAKLELRNQRASEISALRLTESAPASSGDVIKIEFFGDSQDDASERELARIQAHNIQTTSHHGYLSFWTMDTTAIGERMRIDQSGNVGIGTANPIAKLDVQGNSHLLGGSLFKIYGNSDEANYYIGHYPVEGSDGLDIHWYGGVRVGTRGDGAAIQVTVNGNVGIGTATPSAKLEVAGNFKVSGASNSITTPVLTITGGSDLAEPFPVAGPDIPQGAVVIIDDARPGQLKLSERAYDTRVAGIVSGAGGVQPGITLHQQGALEGTQNVALSGRVYALADASPNPIKPGDLLTTSDTPGHVMKAADRERRDGAILGKAMSALDSGQGLVLVLVTLQ
jgi:hypothetical protein